MFLQAYLVAASLAGLPVTPVRAETSAIPSRNACFSDAASSAQRIAACGTLIRSSKPSSGVRPAALLRRAGAYGQQGKYAQAVADASSAIHLAPSAVAYATRALAHHDLGREEEAIRDSNSALRLAPGNENALFVRGAAYEAEADYQRAIMDFTAVLKLDPKRADALFSRGAAYYSAGDYQSAVEDFTASIDSGHGNATVFYLRGLAENELGQAAAARSDLEHAHKLDPHLQQPRPPQGSLDL